MGKIVSVNLISTDPYQPLANFIEQNYLPGYTFNEKYMDNSVNNALRSLPSPSPILSVLSLRERKYYVKSFKNSINGFQYNVIVKKKDSTHTTRAYAVDEPYRHRDSDYQVEPHYSLEVIRTDEGNNKYTPIYGHDYKIDVTNYRRLVCHISILGLQHWNANYGYYPPEFENWRIGLFRSGFPSDISNAENYATRVIPAASKKLKNAGQISFIMDISDLQGEYDFGLWGKWNYIERSYSRYGGGFKIAISYLYLAK